MAIDQFGFSKKHTKKGLDSETWQGLRDSGEKTAQIWQNINRSIDESLQYSSLGDSEQGLSLEEPYRGQSCVGNGWVLAGVARESGWDWSQQNVMEGVTVWKLGAGGICAPQSPSWGGQ